MYVLNTGMSQADSTVWVQFSGLVLQFLALANHYLAISNLQYHTKYVFITCTI